MHFQDDPLKYMYRLRAVFRQIPMYAGYMCFQYTFPRSLTHSHIYLFIDLCLCHSLSFYLVLSRSLCLFHSLAMCILCSLPKHRNEEAKAAAAKNYMHWKRNYGKVGKKGREARKWVATKRSRDWRKREMKKTGKNTIA